MAKGRKLTTDSRSERYLGTINYNQSHETANITNNNESDLEEDEVWSTIHDDPVINRHDHTEWPPRAAARSHRKGKLVGGLTMAFDDSINNVHSSSLSKITRHQCVAASAPVNVPGWSRVYGADPIGSFCEVDDGLADSEIVPPHEYVGQKVAANSVFEGAGRTLKGRDMSRVRDAVWSQTGFYG